MILIWRGWGLLAVVALFPLLASCAGLITVEPFWMFLLAASLSLLVAGAVCVYCGRQWNRNGVEHSFYFIPLQAWGWVYLAAISLFAAVSVVGGIHRMVRPLPGPPDSRRADPASAAVGGGLGLVVVVATAWSLIRLTRPTPRGRPDAEPGGAADGGG